MIRTLVAASFLCCGLASAQDDGKPERRRNVVLFVVDDQGFQSGCYGNGAIKTPSLDRLAAQGTRFTRAYCTTASCSASRSVLLTGRQNHATGHFGHSHGYNHFSTYESVKTLPVMLAEAGYRTCSIGKYHLAPRHVYEFQDYRNQGAQGNRNAVRMAQNAKKWLTEIGDDPFFLYFCTSDPHRGGGPGGFANHNDKPGHYPGVTPVRYQPKDVVVPPWLPDTPACRRELAEYYQAISRLDQGLGVLLDALKETKKLDDTLFLFLSDNGPPFPGAKTTLYEPGMRLPLIVRHPDQTKNKRGGTCEARVTWADITPTILEFCGVKPKPSVPVRPRENAGKRVEGGRGKKRPYEFHGRSFLSVIDEESPDGWDEAFASHTFHEVTMYYPMRVILKGRYKYVFNIAHALPYPFASDLQASPTWQSVLNSGRTMYGKRTVKAYIHRAKHELYDLEEDPHEARNLASDPAHKKTLAELQSRLKAWQRKTRDPWILKWKYE